MHFSHFVIHSLHFTRDLKIIWKLQNSRILNSSSIIEKYDTMYFTFYFHFLTPFSHDDDYYAQERNC